MKIGHIVDLLGNYIEDFLENSLFPDTEQYAVVNVICPDGFYKPRWDFVSKVWYEGLSEQDIQAIKDIPKPITDSEKIAGLNELTSVLDNRTVGMQAIDEFTLGTTSSLDERTQGMQTIDDFSLELISQQAALIETQAAKLLELENRILTLEGGA